MIWRPKKQYNESMKQKADSLEKINKPLAKLTKRRKKTQINKIRDEKGNITADINEIQMIREYFKNLYSCKLENEEEIDVS
jgi:hypothetical protein